MPEVVHDLLGALKAYNASQIDQGVDPGASGTTEKCGKW